ncbi:unnamed protein product [Soboliphyme baturini]|uniref:TLC domain-containing protein n=1 Tax=Soboliphyme baturini TaxID=241478 RepID=A0A183IAX8_9BILA|nr:unnamed protein product [Soboliphyme baturini]
MVTQFVDTVRKDFWVNFVHHITTVLLLSFSWASNFVRVGTLVLIVHDAADFWLEVKKIILRNLILYSTTIEAPLIVHFFPVYYIFNSLLLILLVLQIIWTVLIVRVAMNALRSGEVRRFFVYLVVFWGVYIHSFNKYFKTNILQSIRLDGQQNKF